MSITRTTIKKLCTKAETALAEKTLPQALKDLTTKQLQKKITLARKLRDKYKDLYKRQTRAAKEKTGGGNDTSARTSAKVELFADVLDIFQAQLKKLNTLQVSGAKAVQKTKKAAKKLSPQQKLAQAAQRKKDRATKAKAAKSTVKAKSKTNAKAKKAVETENAPQQFGSFANKQAQSTGHKRQMQQSGRKPILGHVKSAGKRNQAKRDSR